MRCHGCGNLVRDSSRYCDCCGAPLSQDSASTSIVIKGSSKNEHYRAVKVQPSLRRPYPPRHWLTGTVMSVVVLFAAGWLALSHYHEREDTERFKRTVLCAQLARDFAKGKVRDQAEVIRTIYSSKRDSCLATVEHRSSERFFVQIVDPSTGEVLWVDGCDWHGECSERLLSNIQMKSGDVLNSWADKPLEKPRSGNVPRD
jgi:hypothetical protein